MYLQKVYAVFRKSGGILSVGDRLFFAQYDYVAQKMAEEAIEQGIFPKLTKDEIEMKPIYIIREGEQD